MIMSPAQATAPPLAREPRIACGGHRGKLPPMGIDRFSDSGIIRNE
jgi:hypothetical protein